MWNFMYYLIVIILLVYYFFRKRYSFWSDKGIHTPKTIIPFGNTMGLFLRKTMLGTEFANMYMKTKQHPYIGLFILHRPLLLVNDLEIVKEVFVKAFSHFADHGWPLEDEDEPLYANLFNLGGIKWKNLRAKLSPTFTSSRMKYMFDTMTSCCQELVDHFDKTLPDGGEALNIKDVMKNVGTDVIANCAFGVECNSFKDPDNVMKKMAVRITSPDLRKNLMEFLIMLAPKMIQLFKLRFLSKDVDQFFCNLVEQTVNYREKNNVVRNDFMHLLIQLKNKGELEDNADDSKEKQEAVPDDGTRLTMMQLAAQVFVFFIAGFETSSTTASFALYELALNPDIQKTLTEEIDDVLEKHNGKLTYDSLGEMTYLNQVVEETLRKYPPLPVLFRVCTKDYIIPNTNITIEKGTPVMIPIYGIQRDPEYFPNPDKFDPERFLPENKEKRPPFTYLPFGEGPRICIGSRFGMMQVKLGIATLLSKYEISVCEKTSIPMKYDIKSFVLTSEGGVWLNIKKRKTQ